jgi:hypothetical protein
MNKIKITDRRAYVLEQAVSGGDFKWIMNMDIDVNWS